MTLRHVSISQLFMIPQERRIRKQIFIHAVLMVTVRNSLAEGLTVTLDDLPDILLGLAAGYHDLVSASPAFQAEIRTDAQNLPFSREFNT